MLTEAERSAIRKYLGWPGRFHDEHPALEQGFLALTVDDEVEVRRELERITDPDTGIEVRLTEALDRLAARALGTITLNPMEIAALRSEGRRAVARIAALMGVQVLSNAFGVGKLDNRLRFG